MTIDGIDDLDFIKGGQAIERVWLTASCLGLALQPMTAITLFYLRWMQEGKSTFLKKHQKVLEKIYGDYKQIFPVVGDENYRQIMLFRFGYAENIRIRTLRR